MSKLLIALFVFAAASAGYPNEKPAVPRHLHDPYLLVSPERLKELIAALGTRDKIELLLGASAVEIKNGFHTYFLIPGRDTELFPGCVDSVRIRYLGNQAEEVQMEDEDLKNDIARIKHGFKFQGMMALLEGWEESQKRLEEAAMKNFYGPDYKKSAEAEKTEEEKK